MFRINRDSHFSKDKTPRNTAVSGVLTRSGWKTDDEGMAYLHLNGHGTLAAVSSHKISRSALGPIRNAI